MERLQKELTDYYEAYRLGGRQREWTDFPAENVQMRRGILTVMDTFADTHPACHPSLLKSRLHEEMAERFEPTIFRFSPFFYEMGLRNSENWGNPSSPGITLGSWLYHRTNSLVNDREEMRNIQLYQGYRQENSLHVWNIHGGFDMDHHCLGYSRLLRDGLNGVLADIAARHGRWCSPHQTANLEAMEQSCRAVIRIAERFGEKARDLLDDEEDPRARKFLGMIAAAAGHIPARPPRTFYEGLAMLWFLREVTATLEAIGISVIGHPDRQLIDLYRADLAAGRLTEEEARDLLARWMLPTDIKFHVEDNDWPETSTCMELGGCDEDGNVVWNELTRLIIETHAEHRLINPKLNCRYNSQAPQEYLDLISRLILAGHNHFALLNDEVLIPALERAGKTEAEARLYVNGGCQEPMAEGVEHSAGAYYYLNMPRVLDLALRPDVLPEGFTPKAGEALPTPIRDAADFDDFYRRFFAELENTIRTGARWAVTLGHEQWRVHPCPFFSTTLAGCIDKAMDYTEGGAKYNQSGIALVGLATLIDALHAIHIAVYEQKWLSLEEMCACLERNWAGYGELRARIRRLPRFGHNDPAVDALTVRFARDFSAFIRTVPSERGGSFQGSFFVYYFFHTMGVQVRATPDGRKDWEILTQGIAPDRTTQPDSLTEIFHSLSQVDFRDYPANAVLDVQLPAGAAIPVDALSATIRTFAKLGGPTLQLNCTPIEELRDAKLHPENHRDLVVRISGLSAHFVCLQPHVQDEIIERAVMTV
ncbi:MAG TPA: pyruvate formate lyase family protein [Armatimonadota bacterium]